MTNLMLHVYSSIKIQEFEGLLGYCEEKKVSSSTKQFISLILSHYVNSKFYIFWSNLQKIQPVHKIVPNPSKTVELFFLVNRKKIDMNL